jgi:hypothetical protein
MIKKFGLLLALVFSVGFLKENEKQYVTDTTDLQNPGFENGLFGWAATVGDAPTLDTTDPAFGSTALSWDANNASGLLEPNNVTVAKGNYGKACLARAYVRYNSGTAGDYQFTVNDGTNDLVTALDIAISADYQIIEVGFTCPTSGSYKPIFKSTTATPDELLIDDVYIGRDFRIGPVNDQAELVAQVTYSDPLCTWSRTSTTLGAFGTDIDCDDVAPTEDVTSSLDVDISTMQTDQLPTLIINDMPPGRYLITADTKSNSPSVTQTSLAINDGTDTRGAISRNIADGSDQIHSVIVAAFEYSATATRTFQVFAASASGAVTLRARSEQTPPEQLTWTVERYPSQSPRDTVTLETQGFLVEGKIKRTAAANITLASTWKIIEDSALQILKGDASSVAPKIGCANVAEDPKDLECASGNEAISFSAVYPKAGKYKVCMRATIETTGNAAVRMRLVETDLLNMGTILQSATSGMEADFNGGGGVADSDNHVEHCGIFDFTAGEHLIAWFGTETGGGAAAITRFVDDASFGDSVYFSAYPITQNFPQAVALTDIQPTSFIDAEATRLGHKIYVPASGGSNTNCSQTDPVLEACCDGGVTNVKSWLVPSQMQDGSWILEGHVFCEDMTSATAHNIEISGVDFDGASSAITVVCGNDTFLSSLTGGHGRTSSSNQLVGVCDGTRTDYSYKFKQTLGSKPLWAD